MKKIIFSAIATLLIANSAHAVDTSMATDKSKDLKIDKGISTKKSKEKKQSSSTKKSSDFRKDISSELTFDSYPIYLSIAKDCAKERKTLSNFGITYEDERGVNLTKKNFVESLASVGGKISSAGMDQKDFKIFLNCLSCEGAKFAQANLNLSDALRNKKALLTRDDLQKEIENAYKKTTDIKNQQIVKLLKNTIAEIDQNDCIFLHSMNNIACGSVSYDFQKNEVHNANALIYSYGVNFGINSSLKVAIADSRTTATENTTETATTNSTDSTMSKNKTLTNSQKVNQTTSTSKFMPAP